MRGWEAGDKEKEVLLHARRSSELAASGELAAASGRKLRAKISICGEGEGRGGAVDESGPCPPPSPRGDES